MQYEELADGVRHFKETEKGREVMCEAVEKYGDRREEKGKESTKLEAVKNLMETLKLSLDQAMDALKITGKERALIESKFQ